MKIVIIASLKQELDYFTSQFKIECQEKYGDLDFFSGQYKNKKIIVVVSGIGKVNAAIAVTLAWQKYQPQLIINIAGAAGLHPELNTGDVVIATKLQYFDVKLTQFGCGYGQIPNMPSSYSADINLVNRRLIENSLFDFKLYFGLVCSGDNFIEDKQTRADIINKFPEIFALDMKSCAIAQTCYSLKQSFLCISGITDAATAGAYEDFIKKLPSVMKNVTQVLNVVLQTM